MTAQTPDRRQVVRLTAPWQLGLELLGGRLLDLSSMGARVEHAEPLRETLVCSVDLPPTLGSGWLTSRVVWTRPYKREQTYEGETRPYYHSGLAFVELTPEQREALAAALRILQTGE